MMPRTRVAVTSAYARPSPDLLADRPGCSRPKAPTSGGRTRGSSRYSRKPLLWWEDVLGVERSPVSEVVDADGAVLSRGGDEGCWMRDAGRWMPCRMFV
jgi:hypothetical protein